MEDQSDNTNERLLSEKSIKIERGNSDDFGNINVTRTGTQFIQTGVSDMFQNKFLDKSGTSMVLDVKEIEQEDLQTKKNNPNAQRDALTTRIFAAYAVGHFGNDLCAAAWFTYVLYYVKTVIGLDSVTAAFVMLSG